MLGMDFSRLRSLVESTYGLSLGTGRVFFVGNSTNRWHVEELVNNKVDGTVRSTLNSAVGSCEAGRGDVVIVMPGDHTLGAALTPAAGTRIVGVPGMRESTVVNALAATQLAALSANEILLQGLTFKVITGTDGAVITGSNCTIRDCSFRAVSGTATTFIKVNGATTPFGAGTRIEDCFFAPDATSAIDLNTDGNDKISDVIIEGCHIGGDTNGVKLPAHNCTDIYITNNVFADSTNPVNVTAGKTGVGSVISGNSFGVAATNDCTNAALPASYFWVRNYTRAGLSAANPA